MESFKKFKGIFPAVITPFTSDSKIDIATFEKLVDRLYQSHVQGLFVGGNMGEWYTQTIEERKTVAEQAVNLSKGLGTVIVHVGCTRFEDTIELAKYSEKIGAQAIASLPPYHVRLSEKDIISYYQKLCEATSLPVFIYYHPALTGYLLSPGIMEMIEALPNIAGIKYTDYDVLNLFNLLEAKKRSLNIMNGHDQVLFASLLLGASGGIGSFYNIIPKAFARVYTYTVEGDLENARNLQNQINQFIQVIKKSALIPVFKYILHLKGIGTGDFRVTIQPLPVGERDQVKKYLTESQFFNEWTI